MMLSAPDSAFPFDDDLAGEDTGDPSVDGFICLRSLPLADESVGVLGSDCL